MKGGRPRRPAAEARLVREAVGTSVSHDCSTVVAARVIARLVTADLARHIEAQVDPLRASMAELGRKIIDSPTMGLASDPSFDTASLFVEARVARLRARSGMSLSEAEDRAERLIILKGVQVKLERRYLRYLRADK